jgi:8-oxo-dGTP pyrophosphatase MutT (NUDIX family)
MNTTYDRQAIAPEAPFGATVIVYRVIGDDVQVLTLHRAHNGPDYEADWAWTPPAGARWPNESSDHCAQRELLEETGLNLVPRRLDANNGDWALYLAEATPDATVTLDREHDRSDWVSVDVACSRCAPEKVAAQMRSAIRNSMPLHGARSTVRLMMNPQMNDASAPRTGVTTNAAILMFDGRRSRPTSPSESAALGETVCRAKFGAPMPAVPQPA